MAKERSKPWKRRYAELSERLYNAGLPNDPEAERGAIGALLIAPREHAVRIAKRAWNEHFYDAGRGWLWSRLTYWLVNRNADFDSPLMVEAWLTRERVTRESLELWRCMETGMWWHGHYYVDRVLRAAKARGRIETAAANLIEAMEAR